MAEDRATTLLKAALELLRKQDRSSIVLNLLHTTAFYDESDCDGYCLMEDIETHLQQ